MPAISPSITASVSRRCRSTVRERRRYRRFITLSSQVSCSSFLFVNRNEQSTGASVTASISAPADGERVGVRHRAEQRPLGAGHREQRDERADDDRRREEQRPLDLARRVDDPVDQRPRPVGRPRRDVPVDVLDDDHRAVDDDPEVDRPDRQQVGALALHVQHRHREQQRQRDHQRHDPRAGQVAQEDEQDADHQRHADDQVVHARCASSPRSAGSAG